MDDSERSHPGQSEAAKLAEVKTAEMKDVLYSTTSALHSFIAGDSHFITVLYLINSKAEQGKPYYASRIHEPCVRLDLFHEHNTSISNTNH